MKKINEMTKEEILALTKEDINRMVDYQCAEDGIPLLPSMPVEPARPNVEAEKDVTVYELAGLFFTNKGRADQIAKAIADCELVGYSYTSGPSWHCKCTGSTNPPTVSIEKMFSIGKWEIVKDKIETYEKAKSIYNEAKNNYDGIYNKRNEILKGIMEVVDEVREEKRTIDFYTEEFGRYVNLADGSQSVAMKFLLKAYPDIPTKYPVILSLENEWE